MHRSAPVADHRQAGSAPPEPSIPLAPGPRHSTAGAGVPGAIAGNGGGPGQHMQMENVHPLRLRLLLEIERTGSISAAAERCAIGQPSASMHLRTLEAAVGQTLVTRNRRGSRLTPAGKLVASHGARMLMTLESMHWALDALNAPSVAELTVAASQTPSLVLIPPILRDFSARHPRVSFNLRTLPSEMVHREVARGAVDVGIAGEGPCTEPVVREQILIDELVGIAPPGLISSDAGSMSRDAFARYTLLLGPEGSSTRAITERHLASADYRAARIWAFDSSAAIKRAVAEGTGVSFVSHLLVREEIERGELVPFRIEGLERMARSIYAIWSGLAELTPHAARFTTLLMDAHRAPASAGRLR